jgi:UPF0755 protein
MKIMQKKWLLFISLILIFGCIILYLLFSSNTGHFSNKKYLYIKTGSTYEQVLQTLQDSAIVQNIHSFKRIASWLRLSNNIHPGRYEIKKGMGNYTIINNLKKGRQSAVKLVINKLRTKNDIVKKLASQLEPDANAWYQLFQNQDFLTKHQIDSNQIQCLLMPNTYEFYWNVSPEKVMDKLTAYKNNFWNAERKKKVEILHLTPIQVIIIASIVEEETNKKDEKPKIASVYINRYRIGMNLGADPTVKFAVGDFALKRILQVHTQIASPYNTYKVAGLPPGPICTPSESSIDAVLNADETKYLFFCAKEDFSGYHNFAIDYTSHLANAKKYQQALNARGIK